MKFSLHKNTFLFLILGGSISLLRPTVFGEIFSFQISLFCLLILLYLLLTDFNKLLVNIKVFYQLAILIFIYFYMFIRGVIDDPLKFIDLLKGLSISAVVVIVLFYILGVKKRTICFFDGVALLIFLSALSTCISFIFMILGYSTNQMIITNIGYTYEGRGDVIFPFTFIYNELTGNLGGIVRLSGIYREPGCAPVFFCWAASYLYWKNNLKLKWFYILICIFGSIFSLSTVGFLSLITLIILISYTFKIRLSLVLTLCGLFIPLYFNYFFDAEYIGLKSKMESGSGSFEERYEQAMALFNVNNLLFGDGNNWSIYSTNNINLLASTKSNGLFLLIPYLIFYLISAGNFRFFLPALLPAFLILLTSQPIFLEPALVVLIFSWVAIKEIESNKIKK